MKTAAPDQIAHVILEVDVIKKAVCETGATAEDEGLRHQFKTTGKGVQGMHQSTGTTCYY